MVAQHRTLIGQAQRFGAPSAADLRATLFDAAKVDQRFSVCDAAFAGHRRVGFEPLHDARRREPGLGHLPLRLAADHPFTRPALKLFDRGLKFGELGARIGHRHAPEEYFLRDGIAEAVADRAHIVPVIAVGRAHAAPERGEIGVVEDFRMVRNVRLEARDGYVGERGGRCGHHEGSGEDGGA